MNRFLKIAGGVFLLLTTIIFNGCKEDEVMSPEQQLERDISIISNYLTENSINAQQHESGIFYIIHEQGIGNVPAADDYVTINYQGNILGDPNKFDSGIGKSFKLDRLISGWQIGLPLIQEGGKITLYIPSGYGYRDKTIGVIPANSILEFDIDLLSIGCNEEPNTTGVDPVQLQSDIDIIDEYLLGRDIQANQHESGIRYVVHTEGGGSIPTLCNSINVNYSGHLLGDNTIFDSGDNVNLGLNQLIVGWQIGFKQLKVGTSATLYIPSGLGYGVHGAGGVITANANLVFEVDLLGAN